MHMIVLTESDPNSPLTHRQDLQLATAIAQQLGFPIYSITSSFRRCTTTENALDFAISQDIAHIPTQPPNTSAIWLSDLPSEKQYAAFYKAVLLKNIYLLNTPEQHAEIQIANEKDVLQNDDLDHLHSRLRYSRVASDGSPLGRKFRLIIYNQNLVSYGYSWEGDDAYRYLTVPEEEAMCCAAFEVTKYLDAPFVAVDVGQLEDESWVVLEINDPQFSELTQMPLIQFWREMARIESIQ